VRCRACRVRLLVCQRAGLQLRQLFLPVVFVSTTIAPHNCPTTATIQLTTFAGPLHLRFKPSDRDTRSVALQVQYVLDPNPSLVCPDLGQVRQTGKATQARPQYLGLVQTH